MQSLSINSDKADSNVVVCCRNVASLLVPGDWSNCWCLDSMYFIGGVILQVINPVCVISPLCRHTFSDRVNYTSPITSVLEIKAAIITVFRTNNRSNDIMQKGLLIVLEPQRIITDSADDLSSTEIYQRHSVSWFWFLQIYNILFSLPTNIVLFSATAGICYSKISSDDSTVHSRQKVKFKHTVCLCFIGVWRKILLLSEKNKL